MPRAAKLSSSRTRRARTPRPRDAAQTRAALVRSAAELFNRDGYFGTDTNRIARAAGYAPASFYKHFDDKRAVFLEAYRQWVHAEWLSIGELSRGCERSQVLERIARAVLEHHKAWPRFRASLIALAATDAVVNEFRIENRRGQLEALGSLLEELTGGPVTRARVLSLLLCFERLCDAVAWGESEALGVSEACVLGELGCLLSAFRS